MASGAVDTCPHGGGFSHVLASDMHVERFNVEGGTPIRFVPRTRILAPIVFEGAQGAALSIWRTRAMGGFLSTPTSEAALVTIRFVGDGGIVRHDRREEHSAGRGFAMVVSFDRMRDEEASEGFEALSATISIPALVAAQAALDGAPEGPLPSFAPVADASTLPMRALRHALGRIQARLRHGVSRHDMVFPLMAEVVAYQVLANWPRLGPTASAVRAREPRTLRRAKDFIGANLPRKLLLSDVAAAAGVGVRRLQIAFRDEVGTTPTRYIVERRLDAAHGDLAASGGEGVSIRDIAQRWGFTHTGDFSRRYRERFGELPSVTRGRHRG